MKKIFYFLFFLPVLLSGQTKLFTQFPLKNYINTDTAWIFLQADPVTSKVYKTPLSVLLNTVQLASSLPNGDYGDVSVFGSGTSILIDDQAVTNNKLSLMSPGTIKGNILPSTAAPADINKSGMRTWLDYHAVALSGNYNDLSNKPTIPLQFNAIAGTNIGITGTYPNITISNTMAPVNLIAGTNTTITGTYPNFTINSTATSIGDNSMNSSASDPTTGQLDNQEFALYKNTTTSKIGLFVNDGGTIKRIDTDTTYLSDRINNINVSQTLDQTLAVGNSTDTSILMTSQNSQLIIGDDTAHTFYDGADLYPLLSLEKTGTSIDYYSPMLNFKSNALSGIVWQFNPSGIGVASGQGAPYTFMFGTAKDLQYSGIDNYSYSQGLNYNASGGRVDTNQPQFGNTVEWQYEVSGYGWVVENYTTMTAKNGSSIRPLYQIFNRDSLHKSETVLSSDVIRLQGGKYVDIQGAVNFGFGSVGNSGTIMTLSPGTGSGMSGVYIDMTGTENFSNKLRMKRTTGITGSGTMDDILQYSYDGDKPMLLFGPYVYNAVNGFGSGRLDLAPDGLNRPAIYSSYWRTVNIGAYTALNGYQKLGTLQINYGSGTFAEINTGIDQYSALRLHNTANSIDWSFGADANKFFLNNSTDGRRVFNIDNDGAVSIGNGTTSANASAILDITSTTKGFLPPRGTTTQMNAISSPSEGLVFYDLTVHKLYVYDGTTWQACW